MVLSSSSSRSCIGPRICWFNKLTSREYARLTETGSATRFIAHVDTNGDDVMMSKAMIARRLRMVCDKARPD